MLTSDAGKDSRTMKIYTRKGDSSQTSIWGGRRLSKGHVRMGRGGIAWEDRYRAGISR
jgi:hypothetical protein